MITLPQLVTTDTDLTTGLPSGKAADSAQDFLALLAGALGAGDTQGQGAPLTLADLRAAGGKLQKALLAQDGDALPRDKLTALLAARDAQTDESLKGLNDAGALFSALSPSQKTSALAVLSQAEQKGEKKSALSDDDLASLSALFAMLPGQPGFTTAPTDAQLSAPGTSLRVDTRSLSQERATPFDGDTLKDAKKEAAIPGIAADNAKSQAVAAPVVTGGATAHVDAESTPTPVAPGLAMSANAPSTPQAAQPGSPAPVLSAPLGSHEWQQSLSQHITLFTRQGQQSAELRLHPEDLGQVQISLKLDDNHAQLQMVSAHSHVRAALEAALPVLRTQLAESGIQLGQSNISSESFAGQHHSSSQQHASRTPGQALALGDDESELAVPASLQSAARGNGAVDIFA